jgi:hypothetical protein
MQRFGVALNLNLHFHVLPLHGRVGVDVCVEIRVGVGGPVRGTPDQQELHSGSRPAHFWGVLGQMPAPDVHMTRTLSAKLTLVLAELPDA